MHLIKNTLRNQVFQNQLLHNFNKQCLVTNAQKLDFSQYLTVKMEKNGEEQYQLEFPNLEDPSQRPIQLITDECNIEALMTGIEEQLKYLGKPQAFTLDKIEMSNQIELNDLEGDNFYLVDAKNRIYLVQNNDKDLLESYQKIHDYCEKIELSFLERKVISNYLKRFDDINDQNNGSKVFSDEGQNLKDIQFNKEDIVKNLISALPNHKNIQTESEQQMFAKYIELHENIKYLQAQKQILLNMAHRQEKMKMLVGLAALVGQFCFVGVGTYSVWSWDIVEPMAYFTQFLGGVHISFQFFKFQSDYDNTTYLKWRKQQALKRIAKKQNFDLEALKALEDEFQQLEKQIKANVLIHL